MLSYIHFLFLHFFFLSPLRFYPSYANSLVFFLSFILALTVHLLLLLILSSSYFICLILPLISFAVSYSFSSSHNLFSFTLPLPSTRFHSVSLVFIISSLLLPPPLPFLVILLFSYSFPLVHVSTSSATHSVPVLQSFTHSVTLPVSVSCSHLLSQPLFPSLSVTLSPPVVSISKPYSLSFTFHSQLLSSGLTVTCSGESCEGRNRVVIAREDRDDEYISGCKLWCWILQTANWDSQE